MRSCLLLLLLLLFRLSDADDVSRDIDTPKTPGCSNNFELVKVKNWVDGAEKESVVGLSARFGTALPSDANEALRLPAVMANPPNCCAKSTSKLSNSIALAESGECAFTAKAEVAELGGASGLLIFTRCSVQKMILPLTLRFLL